MIYVVTYRGANRIPIKTKVAKGFACTKAELRQELATHIKVPLESIIDVDIYDSNEAADEVIKYHSSIWQLLQTT